MKVSEVNHLLLVDSNLPCDMFNILCCSGATDLPLICKSIGHFRSKKLPYAFWVGFEEEPSWLETELQKLGLITDEMEWAMACDVNEYQEQITDHSDVRKIYNQDGIRDLIQIMKQIFPKQEHIAIESFYHHRKPTCCLKILSLCFGLGIKMQSPSL